jgi:hypothetical protein
MGILHLVRDPTQGIAVDLARRQAEAEPVVLVLLQGAEWTPAPAGLPTVAFSEEPPGPGAPAGPKRIDAQDLVRLLETHDRVFVW